MTDFVIAHFRSALTAIRQSKICWFDWTAPALILITPFVNFLGYHDYGLLRPESLLGVATLAGIGLSASVLMALRPRLLRPLFLAAALVMFLDAQSDLRVLVIGPLSGILFDGPACGNCHLLLLAATFLLGFAASFALKRQAGAVFTAVFAVMLLTTLLLPNNSKWRRLITESTTPIAAANAQGRELPPVIHIVLDEQIGIEGLPLDLPGAVSLKEELLDFYSDNGFRLYGNTFSHYYDTNNSLANLMNGAVQGEDLSFLSESGDGFALTENAWLGWLSTQGYTINVYQTDYLNYCTDTNHRIASCTTYPSHGVLTIRDIEIDPTTKSGILLNYFNYRSILKPTWAALAHYLRSQFENGRRANEFAADRWRPPGLGALWTVPVMKGLIDDLRGAGPGNAYVAHLLLPHRGFVLDETCRSKPDLNSWFDHPHFRLGPEERLPEASRSARYVEYFKQVRCAHHLPGQMMEALSDSGMLDKAVVIVYGDHGSRIAGSPPSTGRVSLMTERDVIDGFSTVFAIRSPGLERGYDDSVRSVQGLFAEFALDRPIVDERATIFLAPSVRKSGARLLEHPLPQFR